MTDDHQILPPHLVNWPSIGHRIIAVDTALTGSGETGRVVQVGMMGNAFPDSVNQVVSVNLPWSPDYMQNLCRDKGIDGEDLALAKPFEDYAQELYRCLDGAVLVTYDGKDCIASIGREYVIAHGFGAILVKGNLPKADGYVDIKPIVEELVPELKGRGLWDVALHFGLRHPDEPDLGNAEANAKYTFRVLVVLMNMAPARLADYVGTARRCAIPPWAQDVLPQRSPAPPGRWPKSDDEKEEDEEDF